MRYISSIGMLSLMASAAVFAADGGSGSAPPAAAAGKTAAKSGKRDTETAVIGEVRKAIPIPAITRGNTSSKSPYPFDTLEVGDSFGISNKTAKQMSSIVSNQNRKPANQRQAMNDDGTPKVTIGGEIKDAAGVVVGKAPDVPVMEQIKVFVVAPVDPKTDPDKAKVRVWRKS